MAKQNISSAKADELTRSWQLPFRDARYTNKNSGMFSTSPRDEKQTVSSPSPQSATEIFLCGNVEEWVIDASVYLISESEASCFTYSSAVILKYPRGRFTDSMYQALLSVLPQVSDHFFLARNFEGDANFHHQLQFPVEETKQRLVKWLAWGLLSCRGSVCTWCQGAWSQSPHKSILYLLSISWAWSIYPFRAHLTASQSGTWL